MNTKTRIKNHCICAIISGTASVEICYFVPIIHWLKTKQWLSTSELLQNRLHKACIAFIAFLFLVLYFAHLYQAAKYTWRTWKRSQRKKKHKKRRRKKQKHPCDKNICPNKTIKSDTRPFYPTHTQNRNKRE